MQSRWTALGRPAAHGRRTHSARPHRANLPVTLGAARVGDLVRRHWVLDDTFQKDRCRLRTGHAARNMAALRRITLNFLAFMQQYFWSRMSICRLRKMVARNPAQLEPIMAL